MGRKTVSNPMLPQIQGYSILTGNKPIAATLDITTAYLIHRLFTRNDLHLAAFLVTVVTEVRQFVFDALEVRRSHIV